MMYLKIKRIKKKLSINDAKKMYLIFQRRKIFIQLRKEKFIKKNTLFLLSTFFERDIFSSESCNLDALFMIGKYNLNLSKDLIETLSNNQYLVFKIGKLMNFNFNLNIHDIKNILVSIFEWFLKFCLSIIDLLLIVFYTLIKIIFNKFDPAIKKKIQNMNCKELYTFFYWKNREIKSITHYFPDYFLRSGKKAFVSMISTYIFLIKGILSFYKYPDLINHFDFINIKDLFKTIKDLLYIYYADIFYRDVFTYGDIIAIANSYKLINRRFFSLLIYNVFPKVINYIKPSELYLWHENQFHHRALSLSLNNIETNSISNNLIIYTYLGTTYFSLNSYPHLVPSRIELKYSLWCKNNFMLQDIGSKDEINRLLNKFSIRFTSQLARQSLQRSKLDNYKLKEIDHSIHLKRYFTFFSHANKDEFYIMLFRFFKNFPTSNLKLSENKFYIRLHPLLSRVDALNQIVKLKENFHVNHYNFKFIQRSQETIEDTINNSYFSIFSQSSLVNIALEKGVKVIAIRTSYFFDPPIQTKFKKSQNLSIL